MCQQLRGIMCSQPFSYPTSTPGTSLAGRERPPELSPSWHDPWSSLQMVLCVQLAFHIASAISNDLNQHISSNMERESSWIYPLTQDLYGHALLFKLSHPCFHPTAVTSSMILHPSETLRSFLKHPRSSAATPRKFISCCPSHQWRSLPFSLLHLMESPNIKQLSWYLNGLCKYFLGGAAHLTFSCTTKQLNFASLRWKARCKCQQH